LGFKSGVSDRIKAPLYPYAACNKNNSGRKSDYLDINIRMPMRLHTVHANNKCTNARWVIWFSFYTSNVIGTIDRLEQ